MSGSCPYRRDCDLVMRGATSGHSVGAATRLQPTWIAQIPTQAKAGLRPSSICWSGVSTPPRRTRSRYDERL